MIAVTGAASTQIWPARGKALWDINFHGVQLLSKVVLEKKIPKLIHIGTANSFAPGPKSNPGSEENPYTDDRYGLDYQDSKYAAQKFLLEAASKRGLPVTIINPTFMFGAYDTKPGSGQMILALYEGKTPGYTRGGKSYIAAKDVAVAAVNALRMGRNGECYLAAGENLDYLEAFTRICRVLGVAPPRLPIPPGLSFIVGVLGSVSGRISGKAPRISFPMARLANEDCYYSNRKAVEELAMPQTPFEVGVAEAIAWFKGNNYV